MITAHFPFNRADLLDMPFSELIEIWLPEALAAQQEETTL